MHYRGGRGPDTLASTIIENETSGRLLIFDATDDMTPVGGLPEYLQGSHGLVISGEKGDLLQIEPIFFWIEEWWRITGDK